MNMEKCPGCGAVLSLSRDRRSLVCDFCGNTYPVDGGESPSKDASDAKVIELLAQAQKLHDKADYTSEVKILTGALELDPDNAMTLNKLGRVYRVLGFNEKALDCYRRALEIDPNFGIVYGNMGAVYIQMCDYQKAVSCYEAGIDRVNKSDRSDYGVFLANYALAVGHCGDKRRAAELLSEAERLGYANGKAIRKQLKLSVFDKLFG